MWLPGSTADTTTTVLTSSLYFDVVTSEEPAFPNTIAEHVVEEGPDVSDNIRVGLNTVELEVFITKEPMDALQASGPQGTWATASGALGQNISYSFTTPNGTQSPAPPGPFLNVPEWFQLPIGAPVLGAVVSAVVNPVYVPVAANAGLPPTAGQSFGAQVLAFSGAPFDPVSLTHDQLKYLRDTGQLLEVVGTKGTYDNMVIENVTMKRDQDTGTGATFTISLKQIRLVSSSIVAAPTAAKPSGNTQVQKGSQATTALPEGAQAESFLSQLQNALFGSGNQQSATLPQGVQTP
jgi:Dit-like tail protein